MSDYRLCLLVGLLGLTAFVPASRAHSELASLPKEYRLPPERTVVPQKGVFLVAKRSMPDPRFRQTVVLLLAHGDGGTLGLIINRPTDIPLSQALPNLNPATKEKHVLFFGGPVATNRLIFLIRSGVPLQDTAHVMADVYYSASRDTLEQVISGHKRANELRMFVGHSGWAPGQLPSEIARGDWLLVRADPRTIFEKDLDHIWPDLIDQQPPPGIFIDDRDHPPPSATVAVPVVACAGK